MKMLRAHLPLFFAAVIPLGNPAAWQDLTFSKIPKNTVDHHNNGITVNVASSASPLIYPFPTSQMVSRVKVEIEIQGDIRGEPPEGTVEEDSYLRLGLVMKGSRRLNFFERTIAPNWVKKLFSLAPPGQGVEKIVFFNVARSASVIGKSRTHPSSDLMEERIVWLRKPTDTKLSLEHILPTPVEAAALWLSIDGDDTKSTYKVTLQKIALE